VVLHSQGHGADWKLGYLGAFLAASLASTYVMYGFDTASSLGEESINPRKNAPRAILRALIASFFIGGLILLFAMMAVGNINAGEISTAGLQYIVLDVLGSTIGKIFLWCVVIAVTVCNLAVHTAAIRMMFAMARDNNLPAGSRLARVHPRTKTPIIPAVVIGVIALAILVVNIRQPQIFVVITSIGIIMIYIAYLLVTGPMLLARLRGTYRSSDTQAGYFSLGRWGLPVNLIAVVWGLGVTINLAWPRASIYNATEPFHWYLRWGAVLFVGIVMVGGFAYYWFVQRHKTGTLAAHAYVAPDGRSRPRRPRRPRRRARRPTDCEGRAHHGGVRLRRRRRRDGRRRRGRAAVRGPRGDRLPARGRSLRRRRPGDSAARGLDVPARLRLRLGLPGRAAGEGQQLPPPRARASSAAARRTTRASRSGPRARTSTSGARSAARAGAPTRAGRSSPA